MSAFETVAHREGFGLEVAHLRSTLADGNDVERQEFVRAQYAQGGQMLVLYSL